MRASFESESDKQTTYKSVVIVFAHSMLATSACEQEQIDVNQAVSLSCNCSRFRCVRCMRPQPCRHKLHAHGHPETLARIVRGRLKSVVILRSAVVILRSVTRILLLRNAFPQTSAPQNSLMVNLRLVKQLTTSTGPCASLARHHRPAWQAAACKPIFSSHPRRPGYKPVIAYTLLLQFKTSDTLPPYGNS